MRDGGALDEAGYLRLDDNRGTQRPQLPSCEGAGEQPHHDPARCDRERAAAARASLSAWVGPFRKSGSPNEMWRAPAAT